MTLYKFARQPLCWTVSLSLFPILLGCAAVGHRDTRHSAQEAAVLATIDEFFLRFAEGDGEAMAALSMPEAVDYIADERKTPTAIIARRHAAALAAIKKGGPVVHEDYWDPVVLVRGSIAVVWAPYELRVDGQTRHCGIDAFQLVNTDGAWRIAGVVFTVEPRACNELKASARSKPRPKFP